MNRVTVILLALVILVAHGLAIHQTVEGDFAAPYETAHVAFRQARNLVHLGSAAWNPGEPLYQSYPSALWVLVCAVAERLYLRVGLFAQAVGILSMLATVAVLAQFSPRRMSGLVAPLLLAASGSAAAAGTGGTETALVMLLLTTAFLAFERGWGRLYAASLALLVLACPEGPYVAAAFALLDRFGPARGRGWLVGWARRHALPLASFALLVGLRRLWTGSWSAAHDQALFAGDPRRWTLGWHYLESFLTASGSGWLLVLPLASWPLGRLPATGARALVLALGWGALVGATGGSGLPLWNALAPALPLAFLSVQECLTAWMDHAPRLARLSWALLVPAVAASFLVSKTPGNIGPFPIEDWQRAWMTPDPVLAEAYGRPLGRLGLDREIREVQRLRTVGAFLRGRVDRPATILSPWPGTVAYLSRKRVQDLLGRVQPAPGETRLQSWRGTPQLDIVKVFSTQPDYIVPAIDSGEGARGAVPLLRDWLRRYDTVGDTPERLSQLLSALSTYELVSAPVSVVGDREVAPPYLLLRNHRLGLSPELELKRRKGELLVFAHHRGPEQVVDLQLVLEFDDGTTRTVRPTGEAVPDPTLRTRTDLLLYPTGPRPVCLVAQPLDEHVRAATARLLNPSATADSPLGTVGKVARLEWR